MTSTDQPAAVDDDRDLEAQGQQRDFLIRSLRDLEAEHDAGDLDEADYESLVADYTVRTAAVLRAIAAAEAPPPGAAAPRPTAAPSAGSGRSAALEQALQSRRRWRRAAIVTIVAAFGAVAIWSVSQSSGKRTPGQTATGNRQVSSTALSPAGTSVEARLVQAGVLVNQGKVADALKLYDGILADDPNQPVALANDGWLLAQAGMAGGRTDLVDAGLAKIVKAEGIASAYPPVHFFRGFLLLRAKNDPAGAVTELRAYLGTADPSGSEIPQIEKILDEAIKAAGPNTPSGPAAATPATAAPAG